MPFSTQAAKENFLQLLTDNHIQHEVQTKNNPIKEVIMLKIHQAEDLQRVKKIMRTFKQSENSNRDVLICDITGDLNKANPDADIVVQSIGELNKEISKNSTSYSVSGKNLFTHRKNSIPADLSIEMGVLSRQIQSVAFFSKKEKQSEHKKTEEAKSIPWKCCTII